MMHPIKLLKNEFKWIFSGILILLVLFFVVQKCQKEPVLFFGDTNEGQIQLSPEEIRSVEDIGQWVFLNIETEEMVDTVRKHFLGSDDALSRIYTGNLKLGLNTEKLKGQDWLQTSGDTARIYMPAIELMDQNFINEAKTKTFYETGKWNAATMKVLYDKAKNKMLKRTLTDKNLKTAQDNAELEISQFFKSFGFKQVEVSFINY